MRKKTINNLFDNILWFVIYLLPIILLCINYLKGNFVDLTSFFNDTFGLLDNVVSKSFIDIFGVNGVMPLFNNTWIFSLFGYYVSVYCCHLVVDFLLFIPRIAHHLLDKLGGSNNEK